MGFDLYHFGSKIVDKAVSVKSHNHVTRTKRVYKKVSKKILVKHE